jgi:hypothetical protein
MSVQAPQAPKVRSPLRSPIVSGGERSDGSLPSLDFALASNSQYVALVFRSF